MLLQETYEIIDAETFDSGHTTGHSDIWYNQRNSSATVGDDSTGYTTVTETDTSQEYLIYRLRSGNAPLNDGYIVEFDMYQVDGLTTDATILVETSNGVTLVTTSLNSLNLSLNEWNHIKIELQGTKAVFNDTLSINYRATSTEKVLSGFLTNGACTTIRFKNYAIYPI